MDDRRAIDSRINGSAPQNSPSRDVAAMSLGRQTAVQDPEPVDFSQFRLTQ